MSLTKQNLKSIKGIVTEEVTKVVNKEVEGLAIAVARGFQDVHKKFDQIDKRFEQVDKRFEQVDKRFEHVDKRFDSNDASHRNINARLDLIETDLSSLRNLLSEVKEIRRLLDNHTRKEDLEKLGKRLLRVEKHLGLVKL